MKQLPAPPEQPRLPRTFEHTRWTPISFVERRRGDLYWLMKCSCGTERVVCYDSYKTGKSLSCGCYRNALAIGGSLRGGNRLSVGESARNQLLLIYRRGAQRRGVEFVLTKEEFLSLTSSDCHYCGSPPTQILDRAKYVGKGNGAYVYNGIDRVDSVAGYTPVNCVPCCRPCNYAKSDMDLAEFMSWIDRLVSFQTPQKKVVS